MIHHSSIHRCPKLDYLKNKWLHMFADNSKPGWILGHKFVLSRESDQASFKECWQSLIWFSYRSDFPPIEPTLYTSDVGWGCTLRTAQMLLANAFLHHYIGPGSSKGYLLNQSSLSPPVSDFLDSKDWIDKSHHQNVIEQTLKIVKMFSDDPTSPYSIHQIATCGLKFHKEIGEWHGPNTVSHVIRELVDSHCPDHNSIGIFISNDGVVYKDKLFTPPHKTQIILVPLRLGVHILNKAYIPSLQMLFSIPQFVGIIGGRPSASYFFIGFHEDTLFYLDPHTNQPYIQFTPPKPEDLVKDSRIESMNELLESYRPPDIGRMQFSAIDPSLTLGFYCKDEQDFTLLEQSITELIPHTRDLPALFTFQDVSPNYENEGTSDLLSFSDGDEL